jgi:hypothetical protein
MAQPRLVALAAPVLPARHGYQPGTRYYET